LIRSSGITRFSTTRLIGLRQAGHLNAYTGFGLFLLPLTRPFRQHRGSPFLNLTPLPPDLVSVRIALLSCPKPAIVPCRLCRALVEQPFSGPSRVGRS